MAAGPNVLLVEDDDETASLLSTALRGAPHPFDVTAVYSAAAALAHLGVHHVDCVLLDYRLPDADGIACLRGIRHRHPDLPVIMITGAGSEQVAVEAMKCGATDYLVKHGPYHRSVPGIIREVLHPKTSAMGLFGPVPAARHDCAGASVLQRIIGSSAAIRRALSLAAQAARSDAPVLLEGETGTGKELLTHAIHTQSRRASGPFLALNCAALPATLLESELFGHLRGSFTGADRDRRGLLEEASGGTLFLDEVGEMSLQVQANLLRVLEDGQVRPVGSSRSRAVNVRVIAATNRDLEKAVLEGHFRRDLYYRLRVFPIRLPPLRERPEDIGLLAVHFLAQHTANERKPIPGFAPETLLRLSEYGWPGNVRELENEVHRLVLVAPEQDYVRPDLLAPDILREGRVGEADMERQLREIIRDVEVATVRRRLEQYGYHRTATARSLGITREALWAKLRQLGIIAPRRGRGSH